MRSVSIVGFDPILSINTSFEEAHYSMGSQLNTGGALKQEEGSTISIHQNVSTSPCLSSPK